jgi:hypothetical protein
MSGKLLILFSIALLRTYSFSQSFEYKVIYPPRIPQNSNFEIAVLISDFDRNSDKVELFFMPMDGISVQGVIIRSQYISEKVKISELSADNFSHKVYKISLNLQDSLFVKSSSFQLLFNLQSKEIRKSGIKIFGRFLKNKNVKDIIGERNLNSQFDEKDFKLFELNFYKPHKVAGNALQLSKSSFFSLNISPVTFSNLWIDFWFKFADPDFSFLRLSTSQTDETIFQLSVNPYQMLSVENHFFSNWSLNPTFLTKKSWHYFSIEIVPLDAKIFVYCDGLLFAEIKSNNVLSSKLLLEFSYSGKTGSYQIEKLRMIDKKDDYKEIIKAANYTSFKSDGSSLIEELLFDDESALNQSRENIKIDFENTKLIKSDAPIFLKAPELNTYLIANYIQLEWETGETSSAVKYIIEKSYDGNDFEPIHEITVNQSPESKYTFFDDLLGKEEIIFYRIRQINIDGSTIYSAAVKIGQGEIDIFRVEPNYPNPFNPKTSIMIEMFEDNEIEISVYNLEGKEVEKIFKGFLLKGKHRFEFNAEKYPSGVYLYKVSSDVFSQTGKMILTK